MSAFETITYVVADGVATITLSRSEQRNTVTYAMLDELIDAFGRIDADPAVRAVVVTGDGEFFSAGTDLSRGSGGFDADATGFKPLRGGTRDVGGELALRIFASTRPVIAAVNGTAVGIGITMILPMDVRIAADSARFALPFTKRGICPSRARRGSCPASSASRPQSIGRSPQGLSARTRRSPPGWCGSCYPRRTSSPAPWRSPGASPATPLPCPSP